MELCRIAFWMFLLAGSFQAAPVDFNYPDLSIPELRRQSCNETARFISPTDLHPSCYIKATTTFIEQLKKAEKVCPLSISSNAIETLDDILDQLKGIAEYSGCSNNTMWEELEYQKFVNAVETFGNLLSSRSKRR